MKVAQGLNKIFTRGTMMFEFYSGKEVRALPLSKENGLYEMYLNKKN